MIQNFKKDFLEFIDLIGTKDSFAPARHADGESNIILNNTIGNKDGWLYKENKNLCFRKDLRNSLKCTDPNFYYGISCSCCDKKNHDYLLTEIETSKDNLTFSNIFVNANHAEFLEKLPKAINSRGKEVVFCSGKKAKVSKLNDIFKITDSLLFPGNCVTWWEKNKEFALGLLDLKANQFTNAIFLIAAGPLSGILIYELWKINRNNIYIDIGSSFDPLVFGRKSRSYHSANHILSTRICEW